MARATWHGRNGFVYTTHMRQVRCAPSRVHPMACGSLRVHFFLLFALFRVFAALFISTHCCVCGMCFFASSVPVMSRLIRSGGLVRRPACQRLEVESIVGCPPPCGGARCSVCGGAAADVPAAAVVLVQPSNRCLEHAISPRTASVQPLQPCRPHRSLMAFVPARGTRKPPLHTPAGSSVVHPFWGSPAPVPFYVSSRSAALLWGGGSMLLECVVMMCKWRVQWRGMFSVVCRGGVNTALGTCRQPPVMPPILFVPGLAVCSGLSCGDTQAAAMAAASLGCMLFHLGLPAPAAAWGSVCRGGAMWSIGTGHQSMAQLIDGCREHLTRP